MSIRTSIDNTINIRDENVRENGQTSQGYPLDESKALDTATLNNIRAAFARSAVNL